MPRKNPSQPCAASGHSLSPHEDEFRLPFIMGEISSKDIGEKYGVEMKNVQYYLRSRGLHEAKRKYKSQLLDIQNNRNEEAITVAREAQIKAVMERKAEDALQYQNWMMDQLQESQRRIETDPDSRAKLDSRLSNLEKIAKLAREQYGLNEREASDHAAQVQILMQVNAGELELKADVDKQPSRPDYYECDPGGVTDKNPEEPPERDRHEQQLDGDEDTLDE